MDLKTFGSNVYSLSGEDGILTEIISRLGLEVSKGPLWCVEFGAWDGVYLSNTFNLVRNFGWNAVYIESDPHKFHDLLSLARKYPLISPLQAFVTCEKGSNSSFDNLLRPLPVPADFDLLSIDIDSNDLEVWESISAYHPKIVVIEVDSSLGSEVINRYSKSGGTNSFAAALESGRSLGYTFVCHTGNLVFVRSDISLSVVASDRQDENPASMFDDSWLKTPTLLSKGRAWLRYRGYLIKKRLGLHA